MTPWTPRWRLSASSSTSRASGGPSGESLPPGPSLHLPCSPFSCQGPVPLLLSIGKSTGSCWSRSTPRTAPGVKVGLGWAVLGIPRGHRGLWWFGGDPRGAVGVSLSLPSPTDAALPEGLSRLFAVLGDLESCHRRAQPPQPPAPALLQLQT